jgi:hypothetical protein
VTPILKGTAARLGLRKPEPPMRWHVTVNAPRLRVLHGDPVMTAVAFAAFRRDVEKAFGKDAFVEGCHDE